MTQIYQGITSNKRKSILLVALFIIILIILGFVFGLIWNNGIFGIIIAVAIALISALITFYSGDKIILKITGAKEADKKQYAHLVHTVEGLAIAAGLPTPKIYVINDNAPNAFATGRDPEHSIIAVTTGLLSIMNRQELEGVIAHEMSHIKNYDIRLMMLTAVLVGSTVLLSQIMLRSFLYSGGRRSEKNQLEIVLVLIGLVLAILSPLIAQLIKLSVSRKREYLADASGALLTRYPPGLANALKKLKDYHQPMKNANQATAHLYISNPFKKEKSFFNNLFSTHPDINDRIKKLEKM